MENVVEKLRIESEKYLEGGIALVNKETDPTGAGDKIIVRQLNVTILMLQEILVEMKKLEIKEDMKIVKQKLEKINTSNKIVRKRWPQVYATWRK